MALSIEKIKALYPKKHDKPPRQLIYTVCGCLEGLRKKVKIKEIHTLYSFIA